MYDDLIFIGMDFVNEPKRMLEEIESKICNEMTPNELKAYKYGIQTAFGLIDGIVNHNPDDIFVHINGLKCQEEFVLEDLINRIGE